MMAGPVGSPIGCPHCTAAASPALAPQPCRACGKVFSLHAGYAMDASIVPPPPDLQLPVLRAKWAETFVYKYSDLQPYGIASGTKDPVIAVVSIDEAGIMFPDVVAMVFWRKPVWVQMVACTLLMLPFTIFFVAIALGSAAFAPVAAAFTALTVYVYYRALVIRAHWVRVIGRYRTFDVRYDRPFWRRQRFHDELLRRAGHPAAPMP